MGDKDGATWGKAIESGANTMAPKGKDKASKAAKATRGSINKSKAKKTRMSCTFHRPKTLKRARDPKYPRKSVPSAPLLDSYQILMKSGTTAINSCLYSSPTGA